ncbi:MAG: OPT/YSL family transporter [Planctomycetes bacterium]|nr:OPT/YSL family transporter [Planctomycetota bacterium]
MDHSRPYRELTPAAMIAGILLGAVLNMGICFAGLQIGFTIVGSAVAAVLGFGILRGLLGRGSILEVNIFQTVASGVNTVNAGVIFTVPVLFLLGMQDEMDIPALLIATIAGSLLGCVLIIPLRKQIIDYERLRFPEGTAVASILKSPGAGMKKSRLLLIGILISATITFLTTDLITVENAAGNPTTLIPEKLDVGAWLGIPAAFNFFFAVSLLSLGAGFLAGRGGLVVLYGTILNYWILIPAAIALGWIPQNLAPEITEALGQGITHLPHGEAAETFFGKFAHFTSRHVGIGMILGGAVAGIVVAAPALKAAIQSLRQGAGPSGEREEAPFSVITISSVIGLIGLFVATYLSGAGKVSITQAFLCTIAGGLWLWLAGLVVAQTTGRTDWSPLSGLALIAIAIMMGILGTSRDMIVPAVTVGAAICVATSMCADMMADLKTGYLVGSKPIKQQIAQISCSWIGPGIALFTVVLLWKAYGFGPNQAAILHERAVAAGGEVLAQWTAAGGTAEKLATGIPTLGAPQAGALQSAIQIVQSGDVPLGKYMTGAIAGLAVSVLVSPGIGVMVGLSLYLPFEYMIVFGIGGLLSLLFTRLKGPHWVEDNGVPLAAGLIVGDALINVIVACIKVGKEMF